MVAAVIDKRGQPKPVDYRNGTKARVARARWKPHGQRLLVRAILEQDFYGKLTEDIDYEPRDACAWEVIAVGAGCAKWYDDNKVPEEERVRPGWHIMHRSVVSDRADINDLKCRYWWMHVEDVLSYDPDPTE